MHLKISCSNLLLRNLLLFILFISSLNIDCTSIKDLIENSPPELLTKLFDSIALDLSNLGITSLEGISQIKVMHNQKFINITELPHLILILKNNKLDDIHPELTKLKNLYSINLNNNKLKKIPEIFAKKDNFKLLYTLVLSNNKINHLDFENWNSEIKDLYLDYNKIKKIPANIKNLKHLVALSLESNELEELPEELCYMKLSKLILNNNKIKEMPANIKNAKLLSVLHLKNNCIRKVPNDFANSEMRSLIISDNYLENIDFVENLPNLETLDASNNNIKYIRKKISWPKYIDKIALANNQLQYCKIRTHNKRELILIDNNIKNDKLRNKKVKFSYKVVTELKKLPPEIVRHIYTYIDSTIWFNPKNFIELNFDI